MSKKALIQVIVQNVKLESLTTVNCPNTLNVEVSNVEIVTEVDTTINPEATKTIQMLVEILELGVKSVELVLTQTNMVPLIVKCVHSERLVKIVVMVVQISNHVETATVVSIAMNLQT
jgi:hypothetical protein